MSKTNVLIAILISVLLSSASSYLISQNTLEHDRKFLVVDLKKLSKALMVNLQSNIVAKGVEMKPEVIQVLAQNEAKKMFAAINRSAANGDIIVSKSSVVHTPKNYDITESIAKEMGLADLINQDLDAIISKAGQQ